MDDREFSGCRLPYGELGLIVLQSCKELGKSIDAHIARQRRDRQRELSSLAYANYVRDTYIVPAKTPRFQSGDAKAIILESVRGLDLYILVDVGNYSCTYDLFGRTVPMGPDEHWQDVKRVLSAVGGRAKRVSVIMPLLYSGRQHRRSGRESLDCALALQELARLGVSNIITFDAHDPRVDNAVPMIGFENLSPAYGILKQFLLRERDVVVDSDHLVVISPDTGAVERAITFGSALGLEVGLFYKRRAPTVDSGKSEIIVHEYMGPSVDGRDVLIIDDIISSGGSVLDIVDQLQGRGVKRIYVATTFGLFTEGVQAFEERYARGEISAVYSTNLTYIRPELLYTGWHRPVDMSEFVASLINRLNHDESISSLFEVGAHMQQLLEAHGAGDKGQSTEGQGTRGGS